MSLADSPLDAGHPASGDGKTADLVPSSSLQNDPDPDVDQGESKFVESVKDLFELLENTADDRTGFEALNEKLVELNSANKDDGQFLKKLINTTQEHCKTTLLHVAANRGFSRMAQQLIDKGADVNAQDDEDDQPLHVACNSQEDMTVEVLLNAVDYIPQVNENGRYPLHIISADTTALKPETVRRLCGSMHSLIDTKERIIGWTPVNKVAYGGYENLVSIFLEANARLDIEDCDGWTPLITAAKENYYGIFNNIVDHLRRKMGEDDAGDFGNTVNKQDGTGMTALMVLCRCLSENPESFEELQKCIDNLLNLGPDFSILNEHNETALYHLMLFTSSTKPLSNKHMNFLERILDSIPKETVLLQYQENKDAFAVLFDEDGLVKILEPIAQALLDSCEGEATMVQDLLFWLAQQPERHTLAKNLVVQFAEENRKETSNKPQPDDLGTWAIYHQQPGCLLSYVKAISEKEKNEQKEREHHGHNSSKEHDSVKSQDVGKHLKEWMDKYRIQQMVTRSNGKGQGTKAGKQQAEGLEKEDKRAEERHNRQSESHAGQKKVPKVTKSDTKDEDHHNDYFQDMEDIIDLFCAGKASIRERRELSTHDKDMEASMTEFHAAIIQIRQENDEVGIYTKYRNLYHVIHRNGSLATVGDIMNKYNAREPTPSNSSDSGSDDSNEGQERDEFTWIHLPSTNMIWMQDILKRVADKSEYSDEEFQELASFLRTTWVQIPDKTTSSRFMRPRYVDNKPGNDEHTDEMPYLSFSSYHKEDENNLVKPCDPEQHYERGDAITGASDMHKTAELRRYQRRLLLQAYEEETQPIHSSPTLDEYYYHFRMSGKSREQRVARNETQVVTKELYKSGEKGEKVWTLLRVNQLWAWTIGEEWLITASSCASSDVETRFVKDILEHLGKKEKEGSNRRGPRSPAELRDLIAEYCISIYERKYDPKDLKPEDKEENKSQRQDQKQQQQQNVAGERERSIRQIFSDAINEIGRVESELFRDFCDRESSDERQKSAPGPVAWLHNIVQQGPGDKEQRMSARKQLKRLNRDTKKAARCLFEIKDIRDELNILKTIAKSQQKVQAKLARSKTGQACHDCHTGNNLGPDINAQYALSDILELDQAAAQAQEALQTTLALQDSQIANLQAEESAQQGRILFVFTLFTVVFVPLSFFTSLFALNVDDFLQAPPWALIVIFTAPLPLLGLAALYVYYSGKNNSSTSDQNSAQLRSDPVSKENSKKTYLGRLIKRGRRWETGSQDTEANHEG